MRFGFKSTFKSLFNVRSWIAWDSLRDNASFIRQSYGQIIRGRPHKFEKQTFHEAVEKYGYTEEFLVSQCEQFERAARAYLCAFTAGIFYTAWLFVKQAHITALVMLPFNFMLFSFYFKESFWAMQIRRRKLGLSFKDWASGLFS